VTTNVLAKSVASVFSSGMLVTTCEIAVSGALAGTLAVLTEVSCGFPKSFPAHVRIIPELGHDPLLPWPMSKIHYSVTIGTRHCIV
jgi:hypothetical protein